MAEGAFIKFNPPVGWVLNCEGGRGTRAHREGKRRGGGSHPRDGRQHLSQQTNNVSSHENKVAAAAKHFLPE